MAAGCVTVVWRVVVVDWVTGSSDAQELSMTPARIENSDSELTIADLFIVGFRCRQFIGGRRRDVRFVDHHNGLAHCADAVLRGHIGRESSVRYATCGPGPKPFHSRCPNSVRHACRMAGRQR